MSNSPPPPYRKKLIEVALRLEAISEESSQRKRKAPGETKAGQRQKRDRFGQVRLRNVG